MRPGSGTFEKTHLDALFGEMERTWKGRPEYERLLRDAHLAIALHDAARPIGDDTDAVVVALVDKYRPRA